MTERSLLTATAIFVGGAAALAQEWAALAGVAGWLGLVLALRRRPRRSLRSAAEVVLAGLRRWRAVLLLVGAATVGANAFAYARLAREDVDILPALLTTLLVAAFAAWIAWNEQEIRHRAER